MITPLTLYNHVVSSLVTSAVDLTGAKLALIASTYTPDADHAAWSDVSAHEIAPTTGYAAGGASIGGSVPASEGTATWDANDVTFEDLDATFAYGVIYVGTTLIGWMEFNEGDDITIDGYNFRVHWSESGILSIRLV